MIVLQKPSFGKIVKKLHKNQKADLDAAIKTVMAAPESGQMKKGDLAGIRVHKFSMAKQHSLLAYAYDGKTETLTLLALGTHENFYRDLKRQ